MIHSRIVTDRQGGDRFWVKGIWRLWAALFVIGFLVSVVHPTNVLLLDHWLWRPILVGSVLLASLFWLGLCLKLPQDQVLAKLQSALPVALAGALLFGLLNIGPQGSGTSPLGLADLVTYFLTLGISPLKAGPEALLRGFVLGLAIKAFWDEYRTSHQDLRAVLVGLVTWLVSSFVLVLPSIIIWVALAVMGDAPWTASAVDLVKLFSHLNLNTYWSNQQLTRWFSGFGGELANMMTLFTASWTLVLVASAALIAQRCSLRSSLRSFLEPDVSWRAIFLLSAYLVGISVGWGRLPSSGLNLVTWLILLIVVGLTISLDVKGFDGSWQLPVILIIAGLLGWSVFLPLAVALCILWSIQNVGDGAKAVWLTMVLRLGFWVASALAGLAFIRGSSPYGMDMVRALLAYGLLIAPTLFLAFDGASDRIWLKTWIAWLVAGLASVLLLGNFTILMFVILAIALCHIWYMAKRRVVPALQYIILVYALMLLVFVFWLPRWINPQLLPL